MFSILVVEDDVRLNKMITVRLQQEQYRVYSALNGEEALELLDREHVDLIICDIMMPKMDGYELTRELREAEYHHPILMITAKSQLEDMEKGFDAGTDDYMVKPINLREMTMRVKALLRRAQLNDEQRLTVGETVLDYGALTVTRGGTSMEMPQKEFYLLFRLLSNPGRVFTRLELLDEIWGMENDSNERNVDAHIKKIRKKIQSNPDFDVITIRGLGYKAVIGRQGGEPDEQ